MIGQVNLKNVQGNILRGYTLGRVRYLVLEVVDRDLARQFLAVSAAGGSPDVPAIMPATPWAKTLPKPEMCFNIGLTYEGLRALRTPPEHLATFPTEFIEGMTKRAVKLGDYGASAPANWPAPFDKPAQVHVIASIYARDPIMLDDVQGQVARAFNVLGVRDGRNLDNSKVFFGYRDSISQPKFEGIGDPDRVTDDGPLDPIGTVLLGPNYATRFENIKFRVPTPDDLGCDGSFNAFRVLKQDVAAFETYLDHAAEEVSGHRHVHHLLAPGDEVNIGKDLTYKQALREIVAAQMCGRWRNGRSVETSPDAQLPDPDPSEQLTNFQYHSDSRCPAGSHLRRVNPRGGQIVQRVANYTRRLVRRGMSYGPDFPPLHPDDAERGLLGNFIGASIGGQFEAVMCDWLNLGLQDPDVTGSNDPLIGANAPETSWFDLSLKNGLTIRLRGFPRFVTTRGGAYTFLPSLAAIRYLSGLKD